jgi:hypothetical protein
LSNKSILYLDDKEIASLWEDDTHIIPIERPGTYIVKMIYSNRDEDKQSVIINSRGVTKLTFTQYAIEAITYFAGTLYIDDKEIVTLDKNGTYTFHIGKLGTYLLKMIFDNRIEKTRL